MADNCPDCGMPLAAGLPEDLCPRCLMRQGFPTGLEDELRHGASDRERIPPLKPEELAPFFPQLEILEMTGHGGMGAVYKARQPKLKRFVALKVLAPERETDPRFAERFQWEAQALAKLDHPNIVTVHDFGATDGLYYLLMEYMDGVNLRQLLRNENGRLDPRRAFAIVSSICEALQYAHDHGVVHRDIKPENVLIDQSGRVKIADFGLATLFEERSLEPACAAHSESGMAERDHAHIVIGTPSYMAPEQKSGSAQIDHRADIYSLGVVFYEMLTGELPSAPFPPPSRQAQIDARLDEIVLRALNEEPENRYQQAVDIKTAVETIALDSSDGAARFNSKFRLSRTGIAAFILLAAIGLVVIAFHWAGARFEPDLAPDASPTSPAPVMDSNPFGSIGVFDSIQAPPVVVRTVPVSGDSNVDPSLNELRVVFSKAMRDEIWSWVQVDKDVMPSMTGEPQYLEDGLTCVLPVKLEPGKVYAIWLNNEDFHGFQDQDGRAAVPYLLIFETKE